MPSQVQLITIAEYARWRGCTEGAVRRALRERRIVAIEGKIDPVAADAQWAANSRPRAPARGSEPTAPAGDDEDGPRAYWRSKSRRERAEAALAEIKLAQESGALVEASDVRAAYSKKALAVREGMLQLPARLAATLAAEPDQQRCHDILDAELRRVLTNLATA
jgi:phage terminase Nu1 subunit (DNA packaging protein)